jgi:kynureninase
MHRDAFFVPGPGPYLLTHSVGCLARAAEAALLRSYLAPWRDVGGDAWETWLQGIAGFRDALAQLLGGIAAQYCPQPNLSAALARFLRSVPAPVDERRVWLAAEDSFPSLGFALQAAERAGFKLRLIPRAHSPAALATWTDALTPDVYGVLVTHVHSNTGVVAPVDEIAQCCRAAGALCVIDVAQSAGILPLQVDALAADLVLGSCVKWLCGGPGAGFMWIRPSLIATLQPTDVGWFSHADPFEFDIHHFEFAADARRFLGGTPCVAPFVLAAEALRLIKESGVSTVLAHNRELMRVFADGLPASWRERLPQHAIGGTLCIDTGVDAARVAAALKEAQVRCDWRGSTVRLSFHLYNRIEDAARVAAAWPARCTGPVS